MKRICYFACYDSPDAGSSRTFTFAKELVRKGYKVTMITSSYNHLMGGKGKKINGLFFKENLKGVDVLWIYGLNYKSNENTYLRFIHMIQYSLLAFFISIFFLKKHDLVMGTTVPSFTGLTALLLAKIKNSKFYLEIRDVWPEELIDLGLIKRNGLISFVLSKIEFLLYSKSDSIISSLPNTSEHVAKIVNHKEVFFLPNPVDSSLEFNLYSGGNENRLEVAYVGSSARAMSISTILNAISLLEHLKINLTIVGPKDHVENFYKLKKEILPKNIQLFDFVPKNKIPLFINRADLLIHSCIDSEQLKFGINSNKILEYLSSGRVIILAAKVKNDPVSLSGGGYVIKPEDEVEMAKKIESIYFMSPLERKKIGEKGAFYAKNDLSQSCLTDEFIKLIK